MKQLTLVLAALAAPLAAQTAYAVDSNLDILYTVDLATGAVTAIGSTLNNGLATPADLAWREDTRELYTIDLSGGEVGTLDTATGVFTPLFQTALSGWQGMCWDPVTARFYLANQSGTNYVLDPATGTTTALGAAGLSLITALDTDASGRVWGIDFSSGNLATIDKTTGAATVVATISPTNMQGLSLHPNGTWYAINTTTDSLYVIDPATSSSLLIGANTGTQFVKGFQIADTAISVGGAPCADGAAGIRRMTWSGSSAIGGTLQLGFETGPSGTVGTLIFGFSAELFGPFPLPLDLSPFGAPGCNLYVSADITSGTVLSGVPTALAMPNTPSLVGGVFFVQAAVVDLSATPNALGLAFTDYLRVVVTN